MLGTYTPWWYRLALYRSSTHGFLNVLSPYQIGKCWHHHHFTEGGIEAQRCQKVCLVLQEKTGQELKPVSLQPRATPAVATLWPIWLIAKSHRAFTGHRQELEFLQVGDGKTVAAALLQGGPGLCVQWALMAPQEHWPQHLASSQSGEFRLLGSPSFCTSFTCGKALAMNPSWGCLPA